MTYTPPRDEIKALAERILQTNHDNLAFYQPANDTFYFALDAKRVAVAYLAMIKRPEPVVVLWE